MKQSPEQLSYCHGLCDAALEVLAVPSLESVAIVTHAFFLQTIRDLRLAMLHPNQVPPTEAMLFPVWLIQSRESIEFLMRGHVTELDNIPLLVERVRETSPQYESCAFLPEADHRRFVGTVRKAVCDGGPGKVSAPRGFKNVLGAVYPDRAFTLILYAQKPIEISVEEHDVAREV